MATKNLSFPDSIIEGASSYFLQYAQVLADAASSVDADSFDRAAEVIATAIQRKGTIFSLGNGGSAAIANHIHCDFAKGAATGTQLRPRVVSLSSEICMITAIGNDIGFDDVFSHQVQDRIGPNDLLLAISSSGNSPNIVKAIKVAKHAGAKTLLFCGFSGGKGAEISDVCIHYPVSNYGIVEDLHQMTMHAIAQYLRMHGLPIDMFHSTKF